MKDFVTFPGPSISQVYLNRLAFCGVKATNDNEIGEPGYKSIEIRRADEQGWIISSHSALTQLGEITIRRLNSDGSWHSIIRISRDQGGLSVSIGYSNNEIGFIVFPELGDVRAGSFSSQLRKKIRANSKLAFAIPESSGLKPTFLYNAAGVSERIDLQEEAALLFCSHQTEYTSQAYGIVSSYQKWPLIRLGLASFITLQDRLNVALHTSFFEEDTSINMRSLAYLSIPKNPDMPMQVYDDQANYLCIANLNSCKRTVTFDSGGLKWHARI